MYYFVSNRKNRGLQIWDGDKLVAKFVNMGSHGWFETNDKKVAEKVRSHPGYIADVNVAMDSSSNAKYIAEVKDGKMPKIKESTVVVGVSSLTKEEKDMIKEELREDYRELIKLSSKKGKTEQEKERLEELRKQFGLVDE